MAEIIESTQNHVPSNSKVNSALTLGIIGTALSGLTALGGLGNMVGCFGGNRGRWNDGCNNWNDGYNGRGNWNGNCPGSDAHLTNEDIYIERSMAAKQLASQKEFYEGKLSNLRELTDAFFQSYKRDVDNSFQLYKYTRDSNDAIYSKISELDKKVDIMGAVRPYQDALIDNKINTNALIADFNLARRTCKMIEGQLVLPATPVVTGYGSYSSCHCGQNTQA